jgi:hypothetical protein
MQKIKINKRRDWEALGISKERFFAQMADKGEFAYMPNADILTRDIVPYTDPANMTFVVAKSSAFKSTWMKSFMFQHVEMAIQNQIDLKIIWFMLEETIEQFEMSVKSYLVGKKGFRIGKAEQTSMTFNENQERIVLTEEELLAIESIYPEFYAFMSYFVLYDNIKSPENIYKKTEEEALKRGSWYCDGVNLTKSHKNYPHKDGLTFKFKEGHENCVMFCVVDHIGLCHQDGLKTYDSIDKLVMSFKDVVSKQLSIAPFFIQQETPGSQSNDALEKARIMTAISDLSEYKSTFMHARVMFTIGTPFEYEKTIIYPLVGAKKIKRVDFRPNELKLFKAIAVKKNTFGITTEDPSQYIYFKIDPVTTQTKKINLV